MLKIIGRLMVVLAVAGWAGSAQSTLIVIGEPGGLPGSSNANGIPFGGYQNRTRYQQIYNSSGFSVPVEITEIQFYMTQYLGGDINPGQYTLSLSTSQIAVDALSEVDLDYNVGSDSQFFNQTTFAHNESAPTVLSFLGDPFFYDLTKGNLLLDIRAPGGTGRSYYDSFFTLDVSPDGIFARACEPACNDRTEIGSAVQIGGLITGFEVTATIPAPATLTLFGIGLACLGWSRRKSKLVTVFS